MVELRSRARPTTRQGSTWTKEQTSRGKTATTRASSSSARGSLNVLSDENASSGRRVLGDIKNVVAGSKPSTEVVGSRRKPLSERNAPVPSHQGTKPGLKAEKDPRAGTSAGKREPSASEQPRRGAARSASEPKPIGLSSAAPLPASRRLRKANTPLPRTFASHVEIPSLPSSLAEDQLSAQIEAAGRRSKKAAPSHSELTRISPDLSEDDLEYFDVSILQQTKTEQTATQRGDRNQGSSPKDEATDAEATASHGSSDKENVPPPHAHPSTSLGIRQSTRPRNKALVDRQPTHSTPISQKRQPLRKQRPSAGQILNDMFGHGSDRSSQPGSPGAARRATPLTDSAKQLLDYQDQGVHKVKLWKEAGHDAGHSLMTDVGSVTGSWPAEDESGNGENSFDAFDNEGMDEFGFLLAEHNIRKRNAQALADASESNGSEVEVASDVLIDIPTDPFSTSDDRRLAEHAFGRMSSPAPRQQESASTGSGSIINLGHHKLEEPSKMASDDQTETESEDDPVVVLEPRIKKEKLVADQDTSGRHVTRSSTKRKGDAAPIVEDSDDSLDLTPPIASRKPTRQAAKSKRAASGIPLKRGGTKEQKMLERLAAEASSSPINSSAPSSPQATRTTTAPRAKKLRMDEALTYLPARKRRTTAPESSGKKSPSTKPRNAKGKGKTIASSTSPKTRSAVKGRRQKAHLSNVDVDDDEESDEAPKKKKRNTVKKGGGKGRGKGTSRVIDSEGSDQEDWRDKINSSEIHSDDSERTKKLKAYRAAEKYQFHVETVLG